MHVLRRLVLRLRLWWVSRRCDRLRRRLWEKEDVMLGFRIFVHASLRALLLIAGTRLRRPGLVDASMRGAWEDDTVDRKLRDLDDELMRCVEEKYELIRVLEADSRV